MIVTGSITWFDKSLGDGYIAEGIGRRKYDVHHSDFKASDEQAINEGE